MPRRVYVQNWKARVPATPEQAATFRSRHLTSRCVRQSSEKLADDGIPDPVSIQLGDLGVANFVPSPMPGANNLMYEEKLTWVAVLEDGTQFPQYQEEEKSSESIPRAKLRKFCLVDDANTVVFVKELEPGWRFFYRRRTALPVKGEVQVVHVVGWSVPVGGVWVSQVAFVYEADGAVCLGDFVVGKPEPVLGRSFLWRHAISPLAADDLIIS